MRNRNACEEYWSLFGKCEDGEIRFVPNKQNYPSSPKTDAIASVWDALVKYKLLELKAK